MIAYCGLDCSKCECYIATQENDDKKRESVAAKWSVEYKAEIKPEHVNCNGCKSDDTKFYFTESICEIRKCNIEKSNDNCAKCNEYRCKKLTKFIEMAPQIEEALEALRG